jgi:hypothetical protein
VRLLAEADRGGERAGAEHEALHARVGVVALGTTSGRRCSMPPFWIASSASASVQLAGQAESTASALVLPLGSTISGGQLSPNTPAPQVSTSRTVPSPPSTTM